MKIPITKFWLIVFVPFLTISLSAQPWLRPSIVSGNTEQETKNNLFKISDRFDRFWKDRKVDELHEGENAEEGGYQQFRRWEWFMKQRTWPSGNFFNPTILYREYQHYKSARAQIQENSRTSSTWTEIGPTIVPNNGGGAGRINVLRFDPLNSNIMYIGAAAGGIWKSTDGGISWSTNSDFLSALSVADIAINPRYPDSIYAATGDGYGYEVSGDFWGGTYAAGVLVSPDGGVTWNPTGLTYIQSQADIIQRLAIHPVHPQILLAATRNNLLRSTDGGITWNAVRAGHYYDIEFNALHPDTVYSTNATSFFRSADAGATWTQLNTGLCNGRISIAVTPSNPEVIYALCESGDFFRSQDGGVTFTPKVSPGSMITFYGYYDAVLSVSPVDENTVFCGGMNMAKSTDGGDSWTQAGNTGINDYVHVDNHFIDFLPGSNSTVFSCNDGGIFKTTDSGNTWSDLSSNLGIKQYYRLSQSTQDPYTIYAGAQDNGTDRFRNGVWDQVYGSDGMECLVDYTNDNTVYVSYQYGQIQKSTDGGVNFADISPSTGNWVTPYIMDPVNPQILYAGYNEVYKTTDGGVIWNPISSFGISGTLIALAVSQSDPDVLYTASLDQIFTTTNGGNSWTDITAGLPVADAAITYIAISNSNPQQVWVTFSGYTTAEKVYESADGGQSWNNFSGTLPNIPVNCIVYQNLSADALYIGTDFGVFYRDLSLNDWVPYSTGLPNVVVDELEIQYPAGKIRAATFGRGLWEAALNVTQVVALDAGVVQVLSPTGLSCDSIFTPLVRIKNFGTDTLHSISVQYQIDAGTITTYNWNGILPSGSTTDISLPTITVSPGSHSFTVMTLDPNGNSDQNPLNDSRVSAFTVNSNTATIPVQEGFQSPNFPSPSWTLSDLVGMFHISNTAGGFGLSTQSLMADFYSTASGTSYLVTPQMNFTSLQAPAVLEFNLAYAVYSSNFHDSLIISVSNDCGITYSRVYSKGDATLATTGNTSSIFEPTPSEWRRDTVDLSSFIGSGSVSVRFEAKTGYGNNLYLDDINIYDNFNSVPVIGENISVQVFPNPSTGVFSFYLAGVSGKNLKLEIYDLPGRLIRFMDLTGNTPMKEVKMDLSGESAGMYYYRLVEGRKLISTGKIILN